ncbi:CHASE2 domain-containing protein [Devosia albogilva]|uniref:CHASE2 domain-containing protein n=1 Tax=Devosia albogilva TaxID=429726 RepID=A0ABW5QPI7_9HYPH
MRSRHLPAMLMGGLVVCALLVVRLADPTPVRVLREATFDLYQQLKPRSAPTGLPLRVVAIDEPSLAQLGQWPWPRELLAKLTDTLFDLGAAVVVYDVLFPEAEPSGGDTEFARALAEAPTVLAMARAPGGDPPPRGRGGFAMVGGDRVDALPPLDAVAAPLPVLGEAAAGRGVANLDRDGASTARRLPLLWDADGEPAAALAVEALRLAQGGPTLVLHVDSQGHLGSLRVGAFDVPTGPSGDLWLYYRLPDKSLLIPTHQVLAGAPGLQERIAGHIVLVGATAAGLGDLRAGALGEAVPGVLIHAQAIEQMLSSTFLHRSDWTAGIEILMVVAACGAVIVLLPVAGAIAGAAFALTVGVAIAASSWLSFANNLVLLDATFPMLALIITFAAMALFQFAVVDADKRRIRGAFAHYVAPSLLSRIETDGRLLRLGGELRDITVMFSDVRNFTALSERTEPAALVDTLNRLFAVLGSAILSRQGTIDKFMGDAVMAFWNAPADVPDHPRLACLAALEMRAALRRHNQGEPTPVGIGIGIATGPALVGNVGFEERFNYSCIGDTVNVASRLEGASKVVGYDILVTAAVAAEVGDLALLPGGPVTLRGVSAPLETYLLVGTSEMAAGAAFRRLQECHGQLLDDLRRGDLATARLAECRAVAEGVDAGLGPFYAALAERFGAVMAG